MYSKTKLKQYVLEEIEKNRKVEMSLDLSFFNDFHKNIALRNHLLAIANIPALESLDSDINIADSLGELLKSLPDEDMAIIQNGLSGAGLEGFFESIGKKISNVVDSISDSVKSALNFVSYAEHEINALQTKLKTVNGSPRQPVILISAEDYRRLSSPRAKAGDATIISSYAKTMDRILSSDIVYKETIRFLKDLTDFFKSDGTLESYKETIQKGYQETIANYTKLLYLKNKVQEKEDYDIIGSDLMMGYTQFQLKVFKVKEGELVNGRSSIEFSHPTIVVSKDSYKQETSMKALSIGDIGRLLKEAEFMLKGIARVRAQNGFQVQVQRAFEQGISKMEKDLESEDIGKTERRLLLSAAKGSEKAVMAVAELPLKIANNHIEIIKTILKVCDKAIDNFSEI